MGYIGGMPRTAPPAAPTVADVARAARVSTATVSRVFNRPDAVRPALRERVQAVVERLGYVPNAGARALSLNRSGTIGVLLPTIDNAIFAQGVDAFQRRLAERGYQLLLATSGYDVATETRQAMNLVARGVEALAMFGRSQQPELLQFLAQRRLPSVHVGIFPAPPGTACVGFDNARAIGQAVRYLLDLGHTRIALLAGITRDNDRAAGRVAGVRRTLKSAGLDLPRHRLVERPYDIAAAREGLSVLLAADPPPSAVLCGNDVLAYGALLEAQRRGIRVPGELSIVGFDDLEMSRHLSPSLTTVHVPTGPMWRIAADDLLERLAGEGEPAQREVEVSLVLRESTGPAQAAVARRARR
jgi:LacI family transcriptional regulator